MRTSFPSLGLSTRDLDNFSLARLLASLTAPTDPLRRGKAAHELAVCNAAKTVTRGANGVCVPWEVLDRLAQRDMTAGTSGQGSQLVNAVIPKTWIDVLRPRSAVVGAGATVIPGLNGQLSIPKVTAGVTGEWVTENTAPTETSHLTTDSLVQSPKCCRAFIDISRTLLLLSAPVADLLVGRDLTEALGNSLDVAALHGPGGVAPQGLAGTTGIGLVVGGDNGAQATYDHVLQLRREVAVDNAEAGALAFITNALVQYKLSGTLKSPTYGVGFVVENDGIAGARTFWTNNAASNLTKGAAEDCSAIFYGNWADLLVSFWGPGIELLYDPFTGSSAGTLRINAYLDANVGVRRAQSFSVMLDALTN